MIHWRWSTLAIACPLHCGRSKQTISGLHVRSREVLHGQTWDCDGMKNLKSLCNSHDSWIFAGFHTLHKVWYWDYRLKILTPVAFPRQEVLPSVPYLTVPVPPSTRNMQAQAQRVAVFQLWGGHSKADGWWSVSIGGQHGEGLDGGLTQSAFVLHQGLVHKVVLFVRLDHAASETTITPCWTRSQITHILT